MQVPDTVRVPVTVSTPKVLQPGQLRPLATWGLWASIGVVALTSVFALLTLAAARAAPGRWPVSESPRCWSVPRDGPAIELARYTINDTLNNTTGDIRGIADVMVGQAESSLHDWLDLTLAAGGVLVIFGVLVAGLGSLRKS